MAIDYAVDIDSPKGNGNQRKKTFTNSMENTIDCDELPRFGFGRRDANCSNPFRRAAIGYACRKKHNKCSMINHIGIGNERDFLFSVHSNLLGSAWIFGRDLIYHRPIVSWNLFQKKFQSQIYLPLYRHSLTLTFVGFIFAAFVVGIGGFTIARLRFHFQFQFGHTESGVAAIDARITIRDI